MIGAGGHAITAANTAGVHLAYYAAVFIFIGGYNRAHRNAGRVATLLAGPRHIGQIVFGKRLLIGDFVDHHPVGGAQSAGRFWRGGQVVFHLTGHHASPAACAAVNVYDHSPLYFAFFAWRHSPCLFFIKISAQKSDERACSSYGFKIVNLHTARLTTGKATKTLATPFASRCKA